MTTVTASITTKKQTVPATPAASGNVRYQLMQGTSVVASVTGNLTSPASFSNVADGDYTVSAQRMSMLNQPIGDAAVSPGFTVVNVAEIDVPNAVTVSV
jgi:hypothetical protein